MTTPQELRQAAVLQARDDLFDVCMYGDRGNGNKIRESIGAALSALSAVLEKQDSSHLAAQPVAYLVEGDEERMLDPQLLWADELCPVSYKDRVTHPLYASSHLAAPDGQARSGSGVPARPTLPGELQRTPMKPREYGGEEPAFRMDAYYYGFSPTGILIIDRILSAVACAGKAYHQTEDWTGESSPYEHLRGESPAEWIQNAATDAAAELALAASPLPQEGRTPLNLDAKDAARYRWLRDMSVPPHNFYISVPTEFDGTRYSAAEVDAAIDAAIAGTQGEQKP